MGALATAPESWTGAAAGGRVQSRPPARRPVATRESLAVHAAGTRILVRAADPALLALARYCLPPGAEPRAAAEPHVTYELRRGRTALRVVVRDAGARRSTWLRAATPGELAALLTDDLEFRVALHAPDRIFVHAAAVAWQGRVIALPGRSFAGKSTLAAALVRAGAQYLSDEFTVLDGEGMVHPFPRPLHLRSGDGTSLCHIPALELGAVRLMPAPLGLVARTRFLAGARWSPRPMTRGETALALLDNAVAARLRPDAALRHVARAVRPDDVIGVRGRRGEAAEAAAWLLDRLERGGRSR